MSPTGIAVTVFSTLLAVNAAHAGASAVPAANDDSTDLQAVVNDLQRQVDELKAAANANWLTQQRADEIRGLVQDVLADADSRASLLANGVVTGWDKGFFIGSADGNYKLQIAGQLQVRAVYNRQENSPSDDNRFGFENRRTKVDFKGHMFDPSWEYYIEAEAGRSGGTFALAENGWLQKNLGNGLKIKAGQFKPMYLREESISSRRLLAVERSLVNAEFSAGTAQGVQASYETDKWRVFGSFIDGIATPNTGALSEDTEYAFTGRAEFLIMGDWKNAADDPGFRGGDNVLMVGGGLSWQRDEFGTGMNLPFPDFNNAEVENLGLTADVTWKMSGASIAAALVYRHLETDTDGATDVDLDQVAFVIRGGFFVADEVELYAQYEWGDLDIDGIEDLSVITFGVTKYWDKHNLKWQSDIGYGINEVASSWATDGAGYRADAADEDGQIVIRSQFQLLF
jgi:hypothetical protein